MRTFDRLESEVRGYIRSFPTIFAKAQNATLTDENGERYIDFLAGAGSLNYGHNNPLLKKALMDYLETDGMVHGLDMATSAKKQFLTTFEERILKPRKMQYKMQFTGPTGTNAVEAAIKLARKWGQQHRGGASRIIVANNGCHGRSLGTIPASDSSRLTNRFEPQLPGFSHVPFNDLAALHAAVDARTVAIMLEPIQNEAGVIPATEHYLKGVERLCRELGILLIFDEVQTGLGRLGTLLAEQSYDVRADIVVLGKGLGGGVLG